MSKARKHNRGRRDRPTALSGDSRSSTKKRSAGIRVQAAMGILWAAVILGLCWVYFPTVSLLVELWRREPENSHGFLVPVLAAAILWRRRKAIAWDRTRAQPAGAILLAGAMALHIAGVYWYYDTLQFLSLIVCLTALVILTVGLGGLLWAWPAIVMLLFMLPLPYRLATALRDPLRMLATAGSTYVLQTLGFPAIAQGYVVVVDEWQIGIAEVCSGLSMLMVFVGLCWATVYLVQRPVWQTVIILASSVPLALVSNVFRIVVAAAAYVTLGKEWGDRIFHDLAGWIMMPFALLLLFLEMWILDHLLIRELDEPLGALDDASKKHSGQLVAPA
jgi:exosortase